MGVTAKQSRSPPRITKHSSRPVQALPCVRVRVEPRHTGGLNDGRVPVLDEDDDGEQVHGGAA